MSEDKKQKVDYSSLSLTDVIRRKIRRKCSFFELTEPQQCEVLHYIELHKINLKIFQYKWFDIITQKFFVNEYIPGGISTPHIQRLEFPNFEEYYNYVSGDIINNACYYGYSFSPELISKYQLDLTKMNFDSEIKSTIDNHSFEALCINKNCKEDDKESKVKRIFIYLSKIQKITTYESLMKTYNKFIQLFGIYQTQYILISYLMLTQKENIREPLIEFVRNGDSSTRYFFDYILLFYGREDAEYIIDNYNGSCSNRFFYRWIADFKDKLAEYEKGSLTLNKKVLFDKESYLYLVIDEYSNNQNCPLHFYWFFNNINDLAAHLNGDLSNADFSDAPDSITPEILKYKTNEGTKFPHSSKCIKNQIRKYYKDGLFHVEQKWFNNTGDTLLSDKVSFDKFFDFVHFLKNDLSDADFLTCEGIENISVLKNLCLKSIKVKSEVAAKMNITEQPLPESRYQLKEFEVSSHLELSTIDSYELDRVDNTGYLSDISFISDIHLLHRFQAYHCKTRNDEDYVIRSIANTLSKESSKVNIIAGDTSSDFEVFQTFVDELDSSSNDYFFTLGNHEFWPFEGKNYRDAMQSYHQFFSTKKEQKVHLLHNNLFYRLEYKWIEISESELINIDPSVLRKRLREARLIIFGGTGFAGANEEFNANVGIYMNTMTRNEEINESNHFLRLYEKITASLKGMNVLIVTHMPIKDWGYDIQPIQGFTYIYGHNHRNYFFDDGRQRIYADNQVGYKGKKVRFKKIENDFFYDWFIDYKDGIHEITRMDYLRFYKGINQMVNFNRVFSKLFLIKREGNYLFLLQTNSGRLSILNGGGIKSVGKHDLNYFYERLVNYASSVRMFISKYDEFQKQISTEIQRIGGSGNIHGCIIDIDFYNHLYLNPLDKKVTPYFAYSITNKYVYKNLPSLLKCRCPELFARYQELQSGNSNSNQLVLFKDSMEITTKSEHNTDTEMYKISRLIKGLQYTTKYNIVRIWNDNLIDKVSAENGKLIVSGILNPESSDELPDKQE